jgi:hypothetical protein
MDWLACIAQFVRYRSRRRDRDRVPKVGGKKAHLPSVAGSPDLTFPVVVQTDSDTPTLRWVPWV